MAYPTAFDEGLTKAQAEALRELNSFQQVSQSDAWKLIQAKAVELVDEAKEEMLGCAPETTLEQRGILQIRWQQREAMWRALESFVNSQLEDRERLIEELKEQDEHSSNDSGNHPN